MPTKNIAPSRRPDRPTRAAARRPQGGPSGRGFGIAVDGATEYALRLIPSDKILGRYQSAHDAWPAIVSAVDAGRAPRTLVLDWIGADGTRGKVSSGVTLEYLARCGLGMPAEHLRQARRS
jgi:hypothetical protein